MKYDLKLVKQKMDYISGISTKEFFNNFKNNYLKMIHHFRQVKKLK